MLSLVVGSTIRFVPLLIELKQVSIIFLRSKGWHICGSAVSNSKWFQVGRTVGVCIQVARRLHFSIPLLFVVLCPTEYAFNIQAFNLNLEIVVMIEGVGLAVVAFCNQWQIWFGSSICKWCTDTCHMLISSEHLLHRFVPSQIQMHGAPQAHSWKIVRKGRCDDPI